MKVFAFLVSIVVFLGGLALFGYAFDMAEYWNIAFFAGGILAVAVALVIPFHVLKRLD